MNRILLFAAALAVFSVGAFADDPEYVFVTRDNTELKAEDARLSDPPLRELDRGERLEVVGDMRGFRVTVRTSDGTVGQIRKRDVSEVAPAGSGANSDIGTLIRDDRTSSESGVAVSGRGLSDAAEDYAENQQISEDVINAVKEMEERSSNITSQDIERFAQDGGLI